MKGRTPSEKWSREHGGKMDRRYGDRRAKIAHRWYWQAAWHAFRLNRLKRRGDEGKRFPYPCWWGSDYRTGRTAKLHWHVGRRPR